MENRTFVGPHNIANTYNGWFHVYSFTILIGIIVSILASWYKLHRHKIPNDSLVFSSVFIIPASLFGASFLGKNNPDKPELFLKKIAFWSPGLSIHGGVLFGVIVGIIIFGFISRRTKVSLWVYGDCIIPNILLGQAIGRWGNFFNHELLGTIVGSSSTDASQIPALSWLPAFIRDNCFSVQGNVQETIMKNGHFEYVFRAPIFLYESLANLTFWILLTFLIPKCLRWIKKPWKVEPEKYQLLTMQDIVKLNNNYQSVATSNFIVTSFNWIKNRIILAFKNHKLKSKYWQEAFYDYKVNELEVKNIQERYQTASRKNLVYAYFNRSKALYYLHNPKGYFVLRSGVQVWLYFFGWNLIRFCLEFQRNNDELFIINRPILDYTVLCLLFVVGLIMAILSQSVIACFFRKQKWTYEKEY